MLIFKNKKEYTISDYQEKNLNRWKQNDGNSGAGVGDEICRGTGVALGRCLRNAMEAGICVLTYRDGDEYVAEQIECPEGM